MAPRDPQPARETFEPQYEEEASKVGQGFMNIPEGVDDEGLPFN